MEITPLLTSVENGGRGDVFWKKYFLGLVERLSDEIDVLLVSGICVCVNDPQKTTQVQVAMELMVLIQRLRAGAWLGGRIGARNKKGLYLYMHGTWGSGDMFLKNIFGARCS
jgi:hypothetical protein